MAQERGFFCLCGALHCMTVYHGLQSIWPTSDMARTIWPMVMEQSIWPSRSVDMAQPLWTRNYNSMLLYEVLTVLFPCVFRCSDENDIMLLFAKISRFPLFENSGFLVETGSFPDDFPSSHPSSFLTIMAIL